MVGYKSKSDAPFHAIDKSDAYTSPREPEYTGGKPINGFDTETADGQLFMLSYCFAGCDPDVLHNSGKAVPSEEIWSVLTNRKARSANNVWYNLTFDANVLLSHVLTETELAELVTAGSVDCEQGYQITYIPGKFLSISDDSGHSYKHFDVSQFFYAPLDDAAEEWLGETKAEGIDTSRFGSPVRPVPQSKADYEVNDYILENWFDILHYAKKDAELVRDLWREAVEVGESIEPHAVPMGAPYSTGYMAQSFLDDYFQDAGKPGMGPTKVAAMAWETYAGGRFEVYERGDVGNVAGPDINSAYPAVLSDLPDPATLRWEQVSDPSLQDLRDADYGFVRATVTTDADRRIQPFAAKNDDGVVVYPSMDEQEICTLKETVVFAADAGYIESMDVDAAWLGFANNTTDYPFQFVGDLYDRRKRFEQAGRDKAAKLIKIVLNSMYGKLCQTTAKRRIHDADEQLDLADHENYLPATSVPKQIRAAAGDGLIESLVAGTWFNPFLATYITGMTRLELHKRTVEYGLENDTYMFATDCIMYDREAYESTDFAADLVPDDGTPYEEQLGLWDYDYSGRAFVIGAGIYEVELADGSFKTQTRGFREADLDGGLRESAVQSPDGISIESTRPTSAGEAIWRGTPLSQIGQFKDTRRTLVPTLDSKRVWPETDDFTDLLGQSQESTPLRF